VDGVGKQAHGPTESHDHRLDNAGREQPGEADDQGAAAGLVGEQRVVKRVGVVVPVRVPQPGEGTANAAVLLLVLMTMPLLLTVPVLVAVGGHDPLLPSGRSAGTSPAGTVATLAVHLASTFPARQ